jgi:glycerophosphoryl diester phosphodiesterase
MPHRSTASILKNLNYPELISYTKDEKNIVMHGENVYSTVCGNDIKVRTHNLEWLQNNCPLVNGEKIMTLQEMLENVDGLFQYYFVEIKVYDPKYAEQQTVDAIETVKKLGMQDRVIFTSYDKTATYIL